MNKNNDLPEPHVTEDAGYLRQLSRRERLAKYGDNCRSPEKVTFTDELVTKIIDATLPDLSEGRD